MQTQNNMKNAFISYFLILLSIFIILIFTKDLIYTIKESHQELSSLETQIKSKNQELEYLSKINSDIKTWKNDIKDFNKFLVNFNENEILEYIYWYWNANPWKVQIESITLTEWKLNDYWFKEWKIEVVATFLNEQYMLNMLNFFINSDKYNLYIHDFSYPYSQAGAMRVTIPLKILYK